MNAARLLSKIRSFLVKTLKKKKIILATFTSFMKRIQIVLEELLMKFKQPESKLA